MGVVPAWLLAPCQNALSSLFQEMSGFAHFAGRASNCIGINWFVKFYLLPMFVKSSYLLIRETPQFGQWCSGGWAGWGDPHWVGGVAYVMQRHC